MKTASAAVDENKSVQSALDSGSHDNDTDEFQLVYNDVVAVADANWVRLYFVDVSLPQGSYFRITSDLDQEFQ